MLIYSPGSEKPVFWIGRSLQDVRAFPKRARQRAGYELRRVQRGLMPADYRPLAVVGSGVYEIRVHTQLEHRVIYVARFAEAVYVLHAFDKKSQEAARRRLDLARSHMRELLRRRGLGKAGSDG